MNFVRILFITFNSYIFGLIKLIAKFLRFGPIPHLRFLSRIKFLRFHEKYLQYHSRTVMRISSKLPVFESLLFKYLFTTFYRTAIDSEIMFNSKFFKNKQFSIYNSDQNIASETELVTKKKENYSLGENGFQQRNSNFYASVENRSIYNSVHQSFNFSDKKRKFVDSVFLHNKNTVSKYLTDDSKITLNFEGLESFKLYLSLIGAGTDGQTKLPFRSNRKLTRKEKLIKKEDSFKTNKKFKRRKTMGNVIVLKSMDPSRISPSSLEHTRSTLAQINFLLNNRYSILKGEMRIENLNLAKEIKTVLFSYSNPTGAYGPDTTLYVADLSSKSQLMTTRRINLVVENAPIKDLNSFKDKIGFFNFNVNSNEEWENSSDVPIGGFFSGQFFSINPFLVLGFILYSILEFFILLYFMSFIFGNPYETFSFFLKYPLVYYYENLAAFPSPNYFFAALIFWFLVLVFFTQHLMELVDEERFESPRLSWTFQFFKEFAYDFIFLWCLIFCVIETLMFLDLLFTRVFFWGTPGYPQVITSVFLALYEIFRILGTTGYFSLYLENFIYFDIKFPTFYFSDFVPLLQRYPLVQPIHFANPLFNRPNFFLWVLDNFINIVSTENSKSFFFSNDLRSIYQREIIQDVRKYNYIRKYMNDLQLTGQLYLRGWNGFNYRLDLKIISDSIIPQEQVIRFDWRFKNSHFDGINSRLFRSTLFGSSHQRAYPMFKKLVFLRHKYQNVSPRYGYLQYLGAPEDATVWLDPKEEKKARKKYKTAIQQRASLLSRLSNRDRQYYRLTFKKEKHFVSGKIKNKRFNFLFSPADYKFYKMKELNRIIPTKTRRNFRNSRLFLNWWSYIPGNTKPRLSFRYRSFIPLEIFSKISSSNYGRFRSNLNESYFRSKAFATSSVSKNVPMTRKGVRSLFLEKPHLLFPNRFLDEKNLIYKEQFLKNKNLSLVKQRLSRPKFLPKANFHSHKYLPHYDEALGLKNKKFLPKKSSKAFGRKEVPSLILERKYAHLRNLPNYPFKTTGKKYHSFAWFFSNLKPFYTLRPVSIFTTFSRLNSLSFSNSFFFEFFHYRFNSNHFSGLFYPFGLFFSGFGRMMVQPVKFVSLDYYYLQNHNFFHSFIDNFFKKDQFITLPTSAGRFNHPINGGVRHSLDFMYPMISELRIKEKLIPLDFFYDSVKEYNWNNLKFDPYFSIRTAKFSKGSCYFLDARIQNWFNFHNVIWNDYYHFFFNRSYKTEGNGSKFCLASFNPLNGPVSYKLFLDSPTLGLPHIGQYFYTYIPWLQYKFRWLLYPTSTYKRFDSFRFIQHHSSKKFYFSSLLKFYQTNLFRWQQAASIFSYNQAHSRNFLIHLFFHKYKILSDFLNLKELFFRFTTNIIPSLNMHHMHYTPQISKVMFFNDVFFGLDNQTFILSDNNVNSLDHLKQSKYFSHFSYNSHSHQIFIPSFTFQDFRFFQYVIDFRRWKSLQTNYLRDWKFENYVKYLGPILYRQDIPSLMGFFAPFEYRNQIFVSKMRNDALRFSVFFPKKIIAEENPFLSNPRFPRFLKPGLKNIRNSQFPSYYAFVINKPFVLNGSNYSYFLDQNWLKRNKLFLRGLYSHLNRFNLDSKFNINYGQGFAEILDQSVRSLNDLSYGFNSFSDLNSKKKRLLKDKIFWLSKTYELKQIGFDAGSILFNKDDSFKISNFSLRKVVTQLGKPLDTTVPIILPKLEAYLPRKFVLLDSSLGDNEFMEKNSSIFDKKNRNQLSSKPKFSNSFDIFTYLNPTIYVSYGGPKALSYHWHRGQSWLKFIIASQNVSSSVLSPFEGYKERQQIDSEEKDREKRFLMTDRKREFEGVGERLFDQTLPQKTNGLFSISQFLNSLNGKTVSQDFIIPEKMGYFNFGLSGIGRLPRLSRSFFHMLFSRNKLDDFRKLKIQYLKFLLMSVPIFHDSEFSSNSSFKLLWRLLFNSKYFSFSDTFRYNVFFGYFTKYKFFPDFSTFLYLSDLGTIVDGEFFHESSIIFLSDQYPIFKAHNRFVFFSDLFNKSQGKVLDPFSDLLNDFFVDLNLTLFSLNSDTVLNKQKSFYFFSRGSYLFHEKFLNVTDFYSFFAFPFAFFVYFKSVVEILQSFFFYFSDFFFSNISIFASKTDNTLLFINKRDSFAISFLNSYSRSHFYTLFTPSSDMLNFVYPSLVKQNSAKMHDLFRLRLYYGSFRSHIHWYVYPVHYFFSLKYSFSNLFFDLLSNFFILNLGGFFKYTSVLDSFFASRSLLDLLLNRHSFLSYKYLFKPINLFNDTYFKLDKIVFVPSSIFFRSFNFMYGNIFFSFNNYQGFNYPVRLFFRFFDKNLFNSLFLFQNLDISLFKYSIAYNSFFFSPSFLNVFSQFNNFLIFNNFFRFNSSNFVLDSERFVDNLFYYSRSIDGSGRYARPRGFSYSMDKIFTYREFDKYRKEHHRQRFRGILPYWIQNSLKNRYNFVHYYSSPERRYKYKLKEFLEAQRLASTFDRKRISPIFTNRISSLNYLSDKFILDQIIKKKTRLSFPLYSFSPSFFHSTFVDDNIINESNLSKNNNLLREFPSFNRQINRFSQISKKNYLDKKFQALHFLKLKENSNFITVRDDDFASKFVGRVNYPFKKKKEFFGSVKEGFMGNEDEINKYRQKDFLTESKEYSQDGKYKKRKEEKKEKGEKEDSFLKFVERDEEPRPLPGISLEKINHGLFSWASKGENFLSPSSINFFSKDNSLNMQKKKSVSLKRLKVLPKKVFFSPPLHFVYPPSADSTEVLSNLFDNKRIPYVFSKMFPLSSDYTLFRTDPVEDKTNLEEDGVGAAAVSWNKYVVQENINQLHGLKLRSFFSSPSSLENEVENFRKIQPRFYKSKLSRPFYSTKSAIGGSVLHNRHALYKYSLFDRGSDRKKSLDKFRAFKSESLPTFSSLPLGGPDHFLSFFRPSSGPEWFLPSTVRRFIRPYNKVLMYMPYLYAKWFTQNPRLSFAVDEDLVGLFLNNNYDEFNHICAQSLLLLKRKIMYNIVNLKLISYKHKLLYFSHIVENSRKTENINFFQNSQIQFLHFVFSLVNFFKVLLTHFEVASLFTFFHHYYNFFLKLLFDNNYTYIRLLENPFVNKFKHSSEISSDLLFFDNFYYNYSSKRILAQISASVASIKGWYNPLGISGQYIPGLNFHTYKFPLNFSYQYPDFYSGRSFSPEIFLLNNLLRQNNSSSARDLFFGEYPISMNYRPSWHFLSFRISAPLSPFIEYELPHHYIFSRPIKQRQWRLPLMSLRRVHEIYPNHLSSFFSILVNEPSTVVGHDITLPIKLKFLNFTLRNDAFYRRKLENSFLNNKSNNVLSHIELFPISLKLKRLSVLSDFNKKTNFSKLVNNRRFSIRIRQWSPMRYNFYYLFNWKNFLHKFSRIDEVGYRNYKLNPYFDLYQGSVPLSLKSRALQHLIVSQIPRAEIDARRRVPTFIPLKDFSLLLYYYFNFVNQNFRDKGYYDMEQKILKYVNRKLYSYLPFKLPVKNNENLIFINTGFVDKSRPKQLNSPYFIEKRSIHSFSPLSKIVKPYHSVFFVNHKKIHHLVYDQSIEKSNFIGSKEVLSSRKARYIARLGRRNTAKFYFSTTFFSSFLSKIYFKGSRLFHNYKPIGFISLFGKISSLFNKDLLIYGWWENSAYLKSFSKLSVKGNNKPINHLLNEDFDYSRSYSFALFKPFFYERRAVSRILSIYQLFLLKKEKERGLNPNAWLSFDIFSRIRPSFQPFRSKFTKTFLMSNPIPIKGFPSYNYQIKSHTRYDNFFDRHPYLSFGIGSFVGNSLLSSESSYKEVRKRSQMFDFSKRLPFSTSPNYSHNPRFRSDTMLLTARRFLYPKEKKRFFHSSGWGLGQISFLFGNLTESKNRDSLITVTPQFSKPLQKGNDKISSTFNLNIIQPFPGAVSYYQKRGKRPRIGLARYPSLQSFFQGRRLFSYRFNNFYKNSIVHSLTLNPIRRSLLFNTFLLRPYTNFLKTIRQDTSMFLEFPFLKKSFLILNDLINFPRNSTFRSYYQPNLKIFFDFNAYKQRYNLSLLFRELSFDQDFQLFLFRKTNFISPSLINYFKNDSELLSEFTLLKIVEYFQFLVPEVYIEKGVVYSKFKIFYFILEKWLLKLNPHYILLVFFDFLVGFFFSLFFLINHTYFMDFGFFLNLLPFQSHSFVSYVPNRSIFQLFFHLSVFREYLKFSWLFSLKFLIFNLDYYPYYFFLFWFLLVSRALSLRYKRFTHNSPFLVPYTKRFSDFRLNGNTGWFELAWKEVQRESLDKLDRVSHSKDIRLFHKYPVSPDDLDLLKKKYKIHPRQEVSDITERSIAEEYIQRSRATAWLPLAFLKLKGLPSKIGSLGFFLPSLQTRPSENMASEDSVENIIETSKFVSEKQLGELPLHQEKLFRKFPTSKGFSFSLFRKTLFLFLTRRITFLDFVRILNIGGSSASYINQYNVDDFGEDFNKLFLSSDSTFTGVVQQELKKRRMLPEDENIHFYRKPGSFVETENMIRYYGTEPDQHYYIIEFPGKFNNLYNNSFSNFYVLRHLNYNSPQIGFLSFPKNAILPNTFEEFLTFCSLNSDFLRQQTNNPYFSSQLHQYRNLWTLFQYVTRYDYNMFSYYNTDDVRLKRSKINRNPLEDRTTLFENLKFWVNRASNDALDFNIFNPYLYFPATHNTLYHEAPLSDSFRGENKLALTSTSLFDENRKSLDQSPYDETSFTPFNVELFKTHRFSHFAFSFLYLFYTYLFLFIYFFFLVICFCLFFLLIISLFNYLSFWLNFL